jgi:hypothetical protein
MMGALELLVIGALAMAAGRVISWLLGEYVDSWPQPGPNIGLLLFMIFLFGAWFIARDAVLSAAKKLRRAA